MSVLIGGRKSWNAEGDPDVLIGNSGGGFGDLFLGVIMIAGAACPLIELARKRASISVQDVLAGLVIAALFFGIGAFIAFMRDRKILDRKARQVKLCWGLFVPREREVHSFDEFDRVSVFRDVRTSRKHKRTTRHVSYRVCLDAEDSEPIELEQVGTEEDAIADADRIASFMGVRREGPRAAPTD